MQKLYTQEDDDDDEDEESEKAKDEWEMLFKEGMSIVVRNFICDEKILSHIGFFFENIFN